MHRVRAHGTKPRGGRRRPDCPRRRRVVCRARALARSQAHDPAPDGGSGLQHHHRGRDAGVVGEREVHRARRRGRRRGPAPCRASRTAGGPSPPRPPRRRASAGRRAHRVPWRAPPSRRTGRRATPARASASAGVNSRSRSPGVRSSDSPKRSTSTTSMPTPTISHAAYSTVTDLARLRGWSTSWPIAWPARTRTAAAGRRPPAAGAAPGTRGSRITESAYGAIGVVALLGQADRAGAARPDLLDAADHLVVQLVAALGRHDAEHRQPVLDQRDRPVLELAGREALGVDVGELLELERALEGDRVAGVPAEEQHRPRVDERRAASA